MSKRFLTYTLILFLLCGGYCGCSRRPVIHHYEQVAVDGWTPGDTLKFHIDSIRRSGNYEPVIGIRTSASILYPYQSLWLAVKQQWHNPDTVKTDTIECVLTNPKGQTTGHGVSIYQYTFPQSSFYLPQGSHADIFINHIMRNDILPGITEIGLRIDGID